MPASLTAAALVVGVIWSSASLLLALAGLVLTGVAWLVAGRMALARREATLEIDDGHIYLDGAAWLSRSEVEQASWRMDLELGVVVHLRTRRGREHELILPDEESARALQRSLGLAVSQSTAVFAAESRVFERPRLRLATFFAAVAFAPTSITLLASSFPLTGLLVSAMALALVAIIVAHFVSTRVVVGADAITLRWLERTEVLPVRDLDRVELIEAQEGTQTYVGLSFVRTNGRSTRLLVGPRGRAEARRELLVERLAEVLAQRSAEEGDALALDAAPLSRQGRDPVVWVRALRALGSGAHGGPRTAPTPADRLWTLALDARADAGSRAAAAVALAAHATPEDRERIRIAAETTADPRLRIALERSIDEQADEAALAESLAALEEARR